MLCTSANKSGSIEAAAEAIDQAEGLLRFGDAKGAWAPSNIAAITARSRSLPAKKATG